MLDYHRIKKESVLDVHEAMRSPLFFNSTINRKLETDFILLILNDLMQRKNAAPLDKSRNRWEIYWHTLEEWASIIYNYVVNNGLTNTVCTFFELTQGDDVVNEGKQNIFEIIFICMKERVWTMLTKYACCASYTI